MKVNHFKTGLKIILSLGGPNPDIDTLKVWFRMLKDVHPQDFEKAVMDICKTHTDLGRINFVAEVLDRAKVYKRERVSVENRAERQLPPKDRIPPEKLKALVTNFNKKLKGVQSGD